MTTVEPVADCHVFGKTAKSCTRVPGVTLFCYGEHYILELVPSRSHAFVTAP